jgi:AmiR/NasT family two-component response regulator
MTDPEDVAEQAVDLQQTLLDECQGELEVVQQQVEHLKIALSSARRIGAAIGILMARDRVTDDEAFERIVRTSQRVQRKVRDVADDVVLTGQLPG